MGAEAMQFTIDPDHPCLPGHFPGRPIVPGVVLLERVLEAIERSDAASHAAGTCLRLPRVKFAQPLLPGQMAEVTLDLPAPGRWRFRVQRGETLLASGEIVAERGS